MEEWRQRNQPRDESCLSKGCTCACGPSAGLFVLAATMGLSLLLLILSGTIGGSWVPMINLIAVFALPVYAVLSRQLAPPPANDSYAAPSPPRFEEGKAIWANFGVCFLGVVLASMIGFPLILLHSGVLTPASFGYWLGSTFIAFLGFGIYTCVENCASAAVPESARGRYP